MNKWQKKGSIEDAVLISLFLIFLAIMAYPMVKVANDLNNIIQTDDNMPESIKATTNTFNDKWPTIIEGIYLLLLLIGYLGVFIFAFFLDSQPAFFILAAIFFTAMILVIPLLANVWQDTTNSEVFDDIRSKFVIIPFVMTNYLRITIVMWVVIGFGLYAKKVAL